MHTDQTIIPRQRILWGIVVCVVGLLGVASCNYPGPPIFQQSDLDPGWPESGLLWRPKTSLPTNWAEGKQLWRPKQYPTLQAELPQVPDAQMVGLDAQCVLCHEAYVTAFANNVHRAQGCEKCHGAASRHISTRGLGPESILLLKATQDPVATARLTTPAERAEVCLQCHETDPQPLGETWRTSTHAHQAVACNDCHVSHYNVPPGTPPTVVGRQHPYDVRQVDNVQPVPGQESLRGTSRNLGAIPPDTCYKCHGELKRFEEAVHPHQIGSPIWKPGEGPAPNSGSHYGNFNCTTCHDPHGNVLATTRKDLCLQCHDGPHMEQWHGSQHDLAGIGCTDCHAAHPKTGRAMAVDQPRTCYKCHSETQQLEEIAGPHQLLGPNNFNCSTCHQPHGRVTSVTRTDQCLSCHTGTPTMAWHTSFHSREGVACADCHDAHPSSHVQRLVGISHTKIRRHKRRAMSVNEPWTCYRCHPKVFGEASLPSHHPIREGKVVCSDCHAGHGQFAGSLKAETLNQLCFECHADKEGPFVWEHAPVTENCAYCHAPHGAVANNLLHQPTTFLCLRCHNGHSTHGGSPQCERCHLVGTSDPILVGGGPPDPSIPTTPSLRQALFTDCTQCHSQVHGSDNPSGFECGCGMRR